MKKLARTSMITALVLFLMGTLMLAGGLLFGANHRDLVKGLEKNIRFQELIDRFSDREWDGTDDLDGIETWDDWEDFWDDWGHGYGDYHHIGS